jgi:hypothetical protein
MRSSALQSFCLACSSSCGPRALRFNNYKLVMRTSYALFMLTTLVGTVLYIIVFVYGV